MLVNEDAKIYAGQTQIVKAYLGNDNIYNKKETPSYTELEYIESNGMQKIDTEYIPNENTTIDITFKITAKRNERSIFAAKWDLNGFVLMDYGSGLRWHNHPGVYYGIGYLGSLTQKITLNIYQNTIYANGANALSGEYIPITYTDTIKLFAYSSSHPSYYRLYEYKISENNVVLHDFIPVLDSGNVPCLYDKITKKYHYNVGSGTFLYG